MACEVVGRHIVDSTSGEIGFTVVRFGLVEAVPVLELARHLEPAALELLAGLRALIVNGPRHAGTSTLVRRLQAGRNLDDVGLRELA